MLEIAAMEFRRILGRHAVLGATIIVLSVAWYLIAVSLPHFNTH